MPEARLLMRKLCTGIALLLFSLGYAQRLPDTTGFATHKTFPPELKEVILETLSHYPELKEARIDFVFDDNIQNVFMQAQPDLSSVWKSYRNRSYTIQMMPFMVLDEKKIPLQDLPRKVLKGWLGHELGHILDYHTRSTPNLLKFGVLYYLSKSFVRKAERRADIYAIQHGLGLAIIATKDYILSQSSLPPSYRKKIRSLYMSSKEVLEIIQEDEETPPLPEQE